jgi:hypothetical protein
VEKEDRNTGGVTHVVIGDVEDVAPRRCHGATLAPLRGRESVRLVGG